MASRSHSFPNAPSPFRSASRVSLPGRGRFASVMLALGTILLMIVAGVLVVFTYLEAVEDAPREAAEDGFLLRPEVDMAK